MDYVDLIQCHDVEFADHDQIVNVTLPALHCLKRHGLARFVGITGLPLKVFPSILDWVDYGTIDTILSFCHYELNDNSLADLIPYLKEKGVGINASPTGMGLLTSWGTPAWHPASKAIIEVAAKRLTIAKQNASTSSSSRSNFRARILTLPPLSSVRRGRIVSWKT
jgi:aryl-alcohol dehydrogenase-like predicted oxidoreductase